MIRAETALRRGRNGFPGEEHQITSRGREQVRIILNHYIGRSAGRGDVDGIGNITLRVLELGIDRARVGYGESLGAGRIGE